MAFEEGSFVNARGQKLITLYAASANGKIPTAVLVWHHGYGEHVTRYNKVFKTLASSGIAVHGFDAHGHGNSEPTGENNRCLVWNFNDLVDDCVQFAEGVRQKYVGTDVPMFIGGQSMGGLVATHVVLKDQSHWNGLILASAAIDAQWNPLLRVQAMLGNILAAVIPRARVVAAVRPEDMSPDPRVVADMAEDPLNFIGNVRARTANEILHGFRDVQRRQGELTIPIYAHHGSEDNTTSLVAVKRLLSTAQSTDVTLNIVQGGFHELLMGNLQEEVVAAMTEWILATSKKVKDKAETPMSATLSAPSPLPTETKAPDAAAVAAN